MLHALALAAIIGSSPPAAAPSATTPAAQRPPEDGCAASIDPSFVRYVPPATRANGGNSLLWWISSSHTPLGAQTLRFGPRPRSDCLGTLQVRDAR